MNEQEINYELLRIVKYFKEKTSVKINYLEYISALLYLEYQEQIENTFDNIYLNRDNFYITEIIDKELERLRKDLNLPRLFRNVNFKNIIINRNIGERSPFKNIIESFYLLEKKVSPFKEESRKLLAKAYEYILEECMKNNEIVKEEECYTPESISNLMAKLIKSNSKNLFDPFCGSGNFFISANQEKKLHLFGIESNDGIYNICMTNLLLHDINNHHIYNNKEELEGKEKKFDVILSNIPFSKKNWQEVMSEEDKKFIRSFDLPSSSVGDYAYVLSMFNHLEDKGVMAVVLPHGVLFRKQETGVRKKLLPYIKAIIGLPENLFYNTRIAVIILVLSKEKNNENILLIDASKEYISTRKNNKLLNETIKKIIDVYNHNQEIEDFSKFIRFEEIEENDFNLTIKRYFKKEEKNNIVKKETILDELKSLEEEKCILEANIKDVLKALNIEGTGNDYQRKNDYHIKEIIASNLKKIRKEKGYTQSEFANFLEISKGYYSMIEVGCINLSIPMVEMICDKLKISIIDLIL